MGQFNCTTLRHIFYGAATIVTSCEVFKRGMDYYRFAEL